VIDWKSQGESQGILFWKTCRNPGFCMLASLLYQRRSMDVHQTLHNAWQSPGLVHYIHFPGLLPPKGILPGAKFTLRPSLALSYLGSITAWHSSSGREPNFAAWYKECN